MKKLSIYHYSLLVMGIIIFDRVTKQYALQLGNEQMHITPFLSFVLTINRGFSWSLFHSESNTIFYSVTAVIIFVTIALIYYAYHLYHQKISIVGELMIIAGSISNIIDRIVCGGVIDFILFSYKNYAWPVFNSADICIVIGVLIMFFGQVHEDDLQ